jgi:hypothetical protein
MHTVRIINQEKFSDMCKDIGIITSIRECLKNNIVVNDDLVNYIDSLEEGEIVEIEKDY